MLITKVCGRGQFGLIQRKEETYMNTLADMNRYGEYFATNEEYIRKYRYCAFHPMINSAHFDKTMEAG